MEPSSFVTNLSSIVVITLALISFYLMARKKGKYVDVIFGFILGIIEKRKTYWFLSSLFIVFSFFSKQIPSGYIIIFICFFLLAYLLTYKKKIRNIKEV